MLCKVSIPRGEDSQNFCRVSKSANRSYDKSWYRCTNRLYTDLETLTYSGKCIIHDPSL